MAGENTTNTPSISTGDQFSQPKTQGNPENAEAKSSMCFSLVAEVLKMQVARLADPHFSRPGPRALARKIPQTFLQIFSIRFATIKKDRGAVAGRTETAKELVTSFCTGIEQEKHPFSNASIRVLWLPSSFFSAA